MTDVRGSEPKTETSVDVGGTFEQVFAIREYERAVLLQTFPPILLAAAPLHALFTRGDATALLATPILFIFLVLASFDLPRTVCIRSGALEVKNFVGVRLAHYSVANNDERLALARRLDDARRNRVNLWLTSRYLKRVTWEYKVDPKALDALAQRVLSTR